MNCAPTLISPYLKCIDRQGRPYSTTNRLAKPVYSRGDPGGRPGGWRKLNDYC